MDRKRASVKILINVSLGLRQKTRWTFGYVFLAVIRGSHRPFTNVLFRSSRATYLADATFNYILLTQYIVCIFNIFHLVSRFIYSFHYKYILNVWLVGGHTILPIYNAKSYKYTGHVITVNNFIYYRYTIVNIIVDLFYLVSVYVFIIFFSLIVILFILILHTKIW